MAIKSTPTSVERELESRLSRFKEQAAWREVIKDTIEGNATGGGLTALHRADREGFEALMASNTEPVVNADTAEAVRKLDQTFKVGPQAV